MQRAAPTLFGNDLVQPSEQETVQEPVCPAELTEISVRLHSVCDAQKQLVGKFEQRHFAMIAAI